MLKKLSVSVLVLLVAFLLPACDGGKPPAGPAGSLFEIGAEGGACKADGRCNTGLICSESMNKCMKIESPCAGGCPAGYECKDKECVAITTADCPGGCPSGKVCSKGMCEVKPCPDNMVFINGDTFQMGSTDGEPNERPVHSVTVSNFCMDINEFTNSNMKVLKDSFPSLGADLTWPTSRGGFNGDSQPLVDVNWLEAKAICEKQGKRLPTEAEWEYAARGGDSSCKYGTKDCAEPNETNACWSCTDDGCHKAQTCNVGLYKSNHFGLYDMSGNVWEWVEDRFGAYGDGAVTSPTGGPISKDYSRVIYVIRGGAWNDINPNYLRAAYRYHFVPDVRYNFIGFRCAVSPEGP